MNAIVLRSGLRIATAFLLGAGALGGVIAAIVAPSNAYFVDFEHGDDSANGRSPDTAWKHAPGDPFATGKPAQTKLPPGAHVRFRGGVAYRGSIEVSASGTASEPILFDSYGGVKAIIDGSERLKGQACPSASACGGAANWKRLVLIEGSDLGPNSQLFAEGIVLRPARNPDPKDAFYWDEVDDMIPIGTDRLASGKVPTRVTAGSRIAIWVRPNLVVERAIATDAAGGASFDPAELDFYTDRPSRYAIVNGIKDIDQVGEFAILPGGGKAVALLPPGRADVEIGQGRGGIHVKGASWITVRNLKFRNMTDNDRLFAGIGILVNGVGARNVVLEDNEFENFVATKGQGAITSRGASGIRIAGNTVRNVVSGSGIRLSGPGSGLQVEGNFVSRVGRTAIMVMGLDEVRVWRNIIADVKGVHGNGISVYLDNHNVDVSANTVLDAKQPLTFRGAGAKQVRRNDLTFRNNLLVGTSDSLGSLISWGASTKGVSITGNVLLGAQFGLRLNARDEGVSAEGNYGQPPVITGGDPVNWQLGANTWSKGIASPTMRSQIAPGWVPAPADWCRHLRPVSTAAKPDATTPVPVGATMVC